MLQGFARSKRLRVQNLPPPLVGLHVDTSIFHHFDSHDECLGNGRGVHDISVPTVYGREPLQGAMEPSMMV